MFSHGPACVPPATHHGPAPDTTATPRCEATCTRSRAA
jgi:hypothetical protein